MEDNYKILIVDPETGPNKTLEEAISKATEKSIIRLTPGVYS
jgi:F-box protein 11